MEATKERRAASVETVQTPILDLEPPTGAEAVVLEGQLHRVSADARRLLVEVRNPQLVGAGSALAEGGVAPLGELCRPLVRLTLGRGGRVVRLCVDPSPEAPAHGGEEQREACSGAALPEVQG